MRIRQQKRAGLTLIEMVLTVALGMLIMLAVFMTMETQYMEIEAGREAIEEATLARNILTRMAIDISSSLGPVDPRFVSVSLVPNNANLGINPNGSIQPNAGTTGNGTIGSQFASSNSSSGTSGTSGTTAGSGTSGATSGSAGTSGTSSSSSSSSGSSSSNGTTLTPVPFNLGIKGDAKWLVLSSASVPRALLASPKAPVTSDTIPAPDLRSVSFWLVDGAGLARKELAAVTSDMAPQGEPSFADAASSIFAPQVQDVQFEYFDGAEWQTSWDGGQLGGSDGNTPLGPPAAVRITITLRPPLNNAGAQPKTYRHVVAVTATNAFTQAYQSGGAQQTLSGSSLIPILQSGEQVQPSTVTNQNGTTTPSSSSGQ